VLIIRREQIQAFEEAQWERFLREMLNRARIEIPAALEGKSEKNLMALLRSATRKAPSFGIILTEDIARYSLLVLRRSSDPATENGPLMEVLNDPDLMGSAKLDVLEQIEGIGG
jgi:hypothetical protein